MVGCWRGCLEWGVDLHIAQLMPLPLTISCFSKIQIGFTFLVLAHLGNPGQRAVKRAWVFLVTLIIVAVVVVLLLLLLLPELTSIVIYYICIFLTHTHTQLMLMYFQSFQSWAGSLKKKNRWDSHWSSFLQTWCLSVAQIAVLLHWKGTFAFLTNVVYFVSSCSQYAICKLNKYNVQVRLYRY